MNTLEWTPEAILIVFNGVWLMGNIVMFCYLMYVLRRDAKQASSSPEETEVIFQGQARKILIPRVGVFVAVELIVQVLLKLVR